MGRKVSVLTFNEEETKVLESLVRSRTAQAQVSTRARILLLKAGGKKIDEIADKVGLNRNSVILCLKKYNKGGIENALYDAPGRGRNPEISDEEKTWIINIACQRPVDFGYALETWTYAKLTEHIHKTAEGAGYTRLSTIHKSTVNTILNDANIKPHKITFYRERRDPNFDEKMHNVLLVYKQLSFLFDEEGNLLPEAEAQDGPGIHTVLYDEKPGIQAIATTSEDLRPNETHSTVSRDYEYRRFGTMSLLATIDLQTGEAIPLVRTSHTGDDYIDFLRILDAKYPKGDKIRIILDNLAVHTSNKVREFLHTEVPGRFEFVFTPKHGSWLNLIESFFSKMTRQMLRGIRVKTKVELEKRIYNYFEEANAVPVVYHWKYKLSEIDQNEPVIVDVLPILDCKKSS